MQISALEIAKLLTGEDAALRKSGKATLKFKEITPDSLPEVKVTEPDASEVARIVQMVNELPEVREEIVMQLNERIERGEYEISGEEIADMMTRRMRADKVR